MCTALFNLDLCFLGPLGMHSFKERVRRRHSRCMQGLWCKSLGVYCLSHQSPWSGGHQTAKNRKSCTCVAINMHVAMQFTYSLSDRQPDCLWLCQPYHSIWLRLAPASAPATAAASCRAIVGHFTDTGCAVYKLKSFGKYQLSWSIHMGSFAIDCKACASRNEPVARPLSEPRSRVAIQT